jgi:hypothetical protein
VSKFRIKMDLPIDADSPEEAAEKFRQWLRDQDDVFSPLVDVVGQEDLEDSQPTGDPIPMDIAVFEWWERTQREHMQPQVEPMAEGEIELESEDGGPPVPCEAGYYSRLSAPGYLDCTEWGGPHETQYLAMEALYNTHGE